jgi:hypothetical protein
VFDPVVLVKGIVARTKIFELDEEGVMETDKSVTAVKVVLLVEKVFVLVVDTTCNIPPVVAKLFFQALPS